MALSDLPPSQRAYEGLRNDHMELRARMREIEDAMYRLRGEGPREGDRDRLVALLRSLRDHLARHFAEEEASDLFTHMEEARATELRSQHERFRRLVSGLVVGLDVPGRVTPELLDELAARMGRLFAEIRWHDAIETGVLKQFRVRG